MHAVPHVGLGGPRRIEVCASAIGGYVGSLINTRHLISEAYFPREARPLAMVGASFADLFIRFVTHAGAMAIRGVSVGVMALATILSPLLLTVWSAALSIWSALIAALIRDAYHGIGLRFVFIFTTRRPTVDHKQLRIHGFDGPSKGQSMFERPRVVGRQENGWNCNEHRPSFDI